MSPKVFAFFFGWVFVSEIPRAEAAPIPNIIVIIADDLGWADVGYNSPDSVYTPNIDALAAGGAKFTQHYVMPQCTPTRAALLTGRFPGRLGRQAHRANNEQVLGHETLTIGSMLNEMNYESYIVGKWHLGSAPMWGPRHHGFERSYGSLTGAVGMYDHRYSIGNEWEFTWHRDQKIIPGYEDGTHVTDLTSREATRFIEKKHDRPFFLYLPYHAPHTPLDERGPFVDLPTQLDPSDSTRWLNEDQISWFNDPEGKIQLEPDPEKRLLLAAVHHLDHSIGEVVRSLDETGQRENTIIFFSSDNGPQVNWGGGAYPNDLHLTDFNQPDRLRGSKLDVYEGGIKVAGFINWPARIQPRVIDEPVHIVDWLPTIASIVGHDAVDDPDLDGKDLAPLIEGSGTLGERTFYWLWQPNLGINDFPNRWAIRRGDWKIVRYGAQPSSPTQWELYNLAVDPGEVSNVGDANPEVREELHMLFEAERAKDLGNYVIGSGLQGPEKVAGPFSVTLKVTARIVGLELSEFEVSGGTAVDLSRESVTDYSLVVNPTLSEPGTIEVYLPGGVAVASLGRTNTPSNRLKIVFDPGLGASTQPIGSLGFGVAARDVASDSGYLMYSRDSIHSRFGFIRPNPDQADHFIVVREDDGVWMYDNDRSSSRDNNIPFEPEKGDVLLAELDFGTNTATLLSGTSGEISGISSGYQSGDLQIVPEQWMDEADEGEFELFVTTITLNDGSVISDPERVEVELFAPWATILDTVEVEVEFAEDVTGLTSDDFSVENGAVSAVDGTGAAYRVSVVPNEAGAVSVSLVEDAVDQGNLEVGPVEIHRDDYEFWANGILADPFKSGARNPSSNADGDGRTNFEEYLFGGNPNVPNDLIFPPLAVSLVGNGIFELDITAQTSGVSYEVKYGEDLKNWFTAGDTLTSSEAPPSLTVSELGSVPVQRHPHWGDFDLRTIRLENVDQGEKIPKLFFRSEAK